MYDDDMMGLAFGEGIFDLDVIKDHVMAAAVGGAAAAAAGYGLAKLPLPEGWSPEMRTRVKLGMGAVAGLGVARFVYERNPEAAMAITGAVTGLSLLGLAYTFIDAKKGDAMTLPGLSEAPEADELDDADDEALLSMYEDGSMSDLHALETTGVSTAPSAFADPTVTPEALFGLDGTIVQEETLGSYNAYMA